MFRQNDYSRVLFKDKDVMKSIFITGAAAGIGKACAEHFHSKGWFVGLYDVDEAGCQELAKQLCGERTVYGRLDVTDPNGWKSSLQAFWEAAGERLDVLLNNAGILRSGDFQSIELAQQHLMVDINIKGVMNGCHSAFSYLQKSPNSCVINMASASAIYGQPDLATYSSSKFFVRGFTEALDLEWRQHDIRVMDIMPLFVQTAMIGQLNDPASVVQMGVHLTPQDVATSVYKAARYRGLFSKLHWPVGASAKAFYQAVKIAPLWLSRLIVKNIAKL